MEITFAVLLWGVRIAFLILLYLFLVRAFGVLHRALVAERAADGATRALGVLVVERSEDLGSTNGTLVNGTRIERAERVRFGDELAIGRIAMRIEKGAG